MIKCDPIRGETIIKRIDSISEITTSIIVPAFNEAEGLPVVLDKILRYTNGEHEILVIDDGSNDGTAETACKFHCNVIRHNSNCGKGTALKTGIRYANGKNLIFIDSDDTYPADVIPQMTELLNFVDLVYGSRIIGRNNIPRINLAGNWVFQLMMHYFYGFKASDYSTGLYGIKKDHWEMMNISSSGFSIEPEIAIKASRMKLKVAEIPITYNTRIGESKLNTFKAGYGHLKTILGHILWRPNHEMN